MPKDEKLLESIYDAALKFLVPLTPYQAYSSIVKEAVKITNADYGSIALREKGKFVKVYSTSPLVLTSSNRSNANTYRAFKEKLPFVASTSSYAHAHPNLVKLSIKRTAFVPLSYQGKAIGVLTLNFKSSSRLTKKELEMLRVYGSMSTLAIRKAHLYAETKRALEMRDNFIAVIAHELRTPLTSISGYVQMLNKRQKDKSSIESKWLENTYSEVIRLGNLINEVLEANRIETKKQQFDWDKINIPEIITDSVSHIKKVYQQHNIIFNNKCDTLSVEVIGDKVKLTQALISLIDNAAKFSETDSKVIIECSTIDKNVHITISDEGKGIEKLELDHVFDGYYKGENNHASGMGLGLLIAKNIITNHRGKIDLNSKINFGTLVDIKIPLATV